MSRGDLILQAARDCLDTPFHLGQAAPPHGIDCIGLVYHAAIVAGLNPHPLPPHYWRGDGHIDLVLSGLRSAFRKVRKGAAVQAGDVLLFHSRSMLHLGIADGQGGMIHAKSEPKIERVVHSHVIPQSLADRLVSVWRAK